MDNVVHINEVPRLPDRARDAHKGDYGRVLVVAGSRGMAGAAGLSGMGALRGGAGLVTVACPSEIAAIVAGYEPCYLTLPLPCDHEGKLVRQGAARILEHRADVIAIGPGLGRSDDLREIVTSLLSCAEIPMVLDADAINLLVGRDEALAGRKTPTVITPHPGEFARLIGTAIEAVQSDREALAVEFARKRGCIVVLKGVGTVTTDGARLAVNRTGNPGMATGGSGDVLTGIVAAFLAQGIEAFSATQLAVHIHGLAGDLAARSNSEAALTARDIAYYIGGAVVQHHWKYAED